MGSELLIPRKWALHAHGQQVVFVKGQNESSQHVLMKAFLWALYLPVYPDLTVEVSIGDRYKPDLVSRDAMGTPRFWGESGQVGVDKIQSLCRRYPTTHFAWAKWDRKNLSAYIQIVEKGLRLSKHRAPFDVISFPADSMGRFIDSDGHIHLTHEDVQWVRLNGAV